MIVLNEFVIFFLKFGNVLFESSFEFGFGLSNGLNSFSRCKNFFVKSFYVRGSRNLGFALFAKSLEFVLNLQPVGSGVIGFGKGCKPFVEKGLFSSDKIGYFLRQVVVLFGVFIFVKRGGVGKESGRIRRFGVSLAACVYSGKRDVFDIEHIARFQIVSSAEVCVRFRSFDLPDFFNFAVSYDIFGKSGIVGVTVLTFAVGNTNIGNGNLTVNVCFEYGYNARFAGNVPFPVFGISRGCSGGIKRVVVHFCVRYRTSR